MPPPVARAAAQPPPFVGFGAPVRQQAANASRCVHYDDGRKFSCDLSGKGYRESMAAVDVDVAPFLRAMRGRTVYFVGDSLTRQHFASFCCLVRAELNAPVPAGIDANMTAAGPGRDIRCYATPPGSAASTTVCWVPSGMEPTLPSTASAMAAVVPVIRAGDVALANEGAWRRAFGQNAELELERAQQFVAPAKAAMARGATVVWRETLVQHFDTPTGQHKTTCNEHKLCERCVPVRHPEPLRRLNGLVSGVMHAAAIGVAPAFEASLPQIASHTARTPWQRAAVNSLDCTHYCEPAPIYDRLSATALALFAQRASEH